MKYVLPYWRLDVSNDVRIPRLQRYMSGRLEHVAPMRPGKTKRDKQKRETKK